MMNSIDVMASAWPTMDQEREMHVVRHITQTPSYRDIRTDAVITEGNLRRNQEWVTLWVPAPVQHLAVRQFLKGAGYTCIKDDGIRISYLG